MDKGFKVTNCILGIILVVIILSIMFYTYNTSWYPRKASDGYNLGYFPMVGLILCLVFAIGFIISPQRNNVPQKISTYQLKMFIVVIIVVISSTIYFLMMRKFGFIVTTIPFVALGVYFLGQKAWKTVWLSSLFITFILFFLFYFLGIELPQGLFI